jgi:hypothetical protein
MHCSEDSWDSYILQLGVYDLQLLVILRSSVRPRCLSQRLISLPSLHSFTSSSPFVITESEEVSHIPLDLHLGPSSGICWMFQSSLPGPPMRRCLRDTVGLINTSRFFSKHGYIRGCHMPSSFRPNYRGPMLVVSHQGPTRKCGEVYSDQTRFPIFEMCVHQDTHPWVITTQVSQNGSQLDLAHC